jgi:hypothetical protein
MKSGLIRRVAYLERDNLGGLIRGVAYLEGDNLEVF